jgi:YD repeat-containing protein
MCSEASVLLQASQDLLRGFEGFSLVSSHRILFTTAFTYDPNSNLLTVTDAKSQQTVYTHNNMNRTATRKELLLNTETSDLNDSLTAVTVRYDEDMFGQCGG